MIVVSNTSPLCYLVLIGHQDVLPALYQKIHTSQSVVRELADAGAPERVQQWAMNPPPWLEVYADLPDDDEILTTLHIGERTALSLADNLRADIVLIDEAAARTVAKQRGLKVAGVLGVLRDAADAGLLDLTNAIDSLRQTNFRASPELLKALLSRRRK
jgi:predicted nucleic acid-binding protein